MWFPDFDHGSYLQISLISNETAFGAHMTAKLKFMELKKISQLDMCNKFSRQAQ